MGLEYYRNDICSVVGRGTERGSLRDAVAVFCNIVNSSVQLLVLRSFQLLIHHPSSITIIHHSCTDGRSDGATEPTKPTKQIIADSR